MYRCFLRSIASIPRPPKSTGHTRAAADYRHRRLRLAASILVQVPRRSSTVSTKILENHYGPTSWATASRMRHFASTATKSSYLRRTVMSMPSSNYATGSRYMASIRGAKRHVRRNRSAIASDNHSCTRTSISAAKKIEQILRVNGGSAVGTYSEGDYVRIQADRCFIGRCIHELCRSQQRHIALALLCWRADGRRGAGFVWR